MPFHHYRHNRGRFLSYCSQIIQLISESTSLSEKYKMKGLLKIILFASVSNLCRGIEENLEPKCSKFDYENKLITKLIRLEHAFELLTEKVEEQTKMVDNKLGQFSEQSQSQERRIQDMIRNMNDSIEAVETRVRETESRMRKVSSSVNNTVDAKISTVYMNLNSSIEGLIQKVAHKNEAVVFSARELKNTDVPNGQKLIYTIIIENLGNHYDPDTGVFTVPVAGVYLFTVQLAIHWTGSKHAGLKIIANGEVIGNGFNYASGSYSTTTITGIRSLQQGDTVWVESQYRHPSTGQLFYEDYPQYGYINSFKGILIL